MREMSLNIHWPSERQMQRTIPWNERIYRDLSELGYRTGTPDRSLHPDLYAAFLLEGKRCVALVHKAAGIHGDLEACIEYTLKRDYIHCMYVLYTVCNAYCMYVTYHSAVVCTIDAYIHTYSHANMVLPTQLIIGSPYIY